MVQLATTSMLLSLYSFLFSTTFAFTNKQPRLERLSTALRVSAPLKPAAIPLMDSGKALARSGELLIDLTRNLELYGGGLSSAGAQIRNSGDAIAQAAALCRFKTGLELLWDELREAATCLTEGTEKLSLAVEEAEADKDEVLGKRIGT